MRKPSCPICKRPVQGPSYAPFCSRRCADIDLQRWFSGAYAIPVAEQEMDSTRAEGEAGQGGDPHL